MSIRVRTEDLLARLPQAIKHSVDRGTKSQGVIDEGLAKQNFDPHLYSFYEKQKKGGGKIKAADLEAAYRAEAEAVVKKAAGVGRSAAWLSIREAEALPDGLGQLYRSVRAERAQNAAFKQALSEPFPGGKADTDLFFGRYLGMDRKRNAEKMLETAQVIDRLPEIFDQAKSSGSMKAGSTTILAHPKGKDVAVEGRNYYNYGGGTKMIFRDGDHAVAVGWEKSFGDNPIGKLVISRFDLKAHDSDPLGITTFETPGSSIYDLISSISSSAILKDLKLEKSPDEKLFNRMGGDVDLVGLAIVAKAVAAFSGDSPKTSQLIDLALAKSEKRAAEHVPEFFLKAGAIDKYKEIAETVKKHGELTLGDMDAYVRIADKFEKETYDAKDKEITVTLVEGKGPLLIVDNIFGGLGHAVPLAALEKGELEIYMSHETSARGKLHIDAGGKTITAPDTTMARRVADDLIEFLPAGIEHAIEA